MPVYISFADKGFWDCYHKLPDDVRQLADKAYGLFNNNPQHPSLRFKKVGKKQPVYSARVTDDYRALGYLLDDSVYWFWIGNHRSYDRMIRSL